MMPSEQRQGVEIRADGRTLTGAAVKYGDVSPSHRERFERGAFNVSPDLAPTLGHRTGRVLAYGSDVRVKDRADALIVSAHLPRTQIAHLALDGVKSGRYRGWSVEFIARRESRDTDGVRVISSADLPGLALVDHPSYPGSMVEARQRSGGFRTALKPGRKMDCRCSARKTGSAARNVEFGNTAFGDLPKDVAAVVRGLDTTVGRTADGSLRLRRGRDGSLVIDLDPLDTTDGRRLRELVAAEVPVHARPVWDPDLSTWRLVGDTAVVTAAVFALLLVRPVQPDRSDGLDPLEPVTRPENRSGLVTVEPLDALTGLVRLPGKRTRRWL